MDLSPAESEALTTGAKAHGTNKKALIFAALKIAYGIEPGKPIPKPNPPNPPNPPKTQ